MSADPWFNGRRPSLRPNGGGPLSLLEELDAPTWMREGLCAQTDPEMFFPEKGGSVREAKRTCMSCDVRAECLAYAIEHQERFGIWGGLSERERRRLISDNTEPRVCAREDCDEIIPVYVHRTRKFHTPECGQITRKRAQGVA